jgi:hypothetical protein
MRFAGEAVSGNPNVLIYRFKSDKGNGAYAVWCPTSENVTVANFALSTAGAKTATQLTLQGGQTRGITTPLTIQAARQS